MGSCPTSFLHAKLSTNLRSEFFWNMSDANFIVYAKKSIEIVKSQLENQPGDSKDIISSLQPPMEVSSIFRFIQSMNNTK